MNATEFSKDKVASLTLLLFCLCVAYVILRNLKDAVILTGGSAGAEVIPFLKVWGMLPASCAMAGIFTFLSRRMRLKSLFYLLILAFLAYYLSFAFFLFPQRHELALSSVAGPLRQWLPHGWRGMIQMVEHWPESSFYIMSELWATVIVNVLFWGMVNEATNTTESKRFFGTIKFGGTISAFAGGALATLMTAKQMDGRIPLGQTIFEQTLLKQTLLVTLLAAAACFLFFRLGSLFAPEGSVSSQQRKVRMTLWKAVSSVSCSPYLMSLAICVVGYNLVFNLSDVLWKNEVARAFPDPNDLMAYMNGITTCVGAIAVVAVLISGWIVRKLGWGILAGLTPGAILLTSAGFFSILFFGKGLGASQTFFLLTFGAVQNCLAKALKYSVFDVSKELAFVPLDADVKWNGKAAIDGIGNDIGKTGASLAHQGLLIHFGSMLASAPYVAAVILCALVAWLFAVRFVGKAYEGKRERSELEQST